MERDKKLKILYKKERTGFILKNLTHLYSLFSESGKVTMKRATDKNVLYRVDTTFYGNYSLEKGTFKFQITGYLNRRNPFISFKDERPFSREIMRDFSQYSLSFSTLIVYPLLNGDLIKKFIHYYHLRVK